MFPKVTVELAGLSKDELIALRDGIKLAAKAYQTAKASGAELSAEDNAGVVAAAADRARITARLEEIEAEEAEVAAAEAALDELAADEDEGDEPETDETPEDDEDDEDDEPETKASGGGVGTIARPTRPRQAPARVTEQAPADIRPIGQLDVLLSTGAIATGPAKDTPFGSWGDLGAAMHDFAKNNASGRKVELAVIKGDYEGREFTDSPVDNLRLFERSADPELTAALCAPATPYYNLGCMNTTRRPVFNSLPQFAAPRMAVSIYPSPTLEDIDAGTGIWDYLDDADPNAVKAACQTIDCADSETYRVYGNYRCITIKNMLAMSFPELVEAYLNRLAAASARLAEIQLLNAMGAEATYMLTPPLDYDGPVAVASQLAETMALHQEAQRWDNTQGWVGWLPRWVQTGIKVSLMRRRVTNGQGVRVPTDAEVDAIFLNQGIRPVWMIDTPTWAATIPKAVNASSAGVLPNRVDMVIAPAGKFAVMDRGQLSIGVTGSNIYRDNTSNTKNEFTMFFENFEGLVNTDSCPAYRLRIPVCWNGVQIADITAPECDGTTSGS